MRTLLLTLLISTSAFAADLTGTVVDPAGKPVRGAHVYVYAAFPKLGLSSVCPNCYRDCGKHEPVDKKGAFRVKSVDETLYFDVLAVADGYEPAFARRADPNGAPSRITLTRRTTDDADRLITGIVLDPKGKPVIGAAVEPSGYHLGSSTGYGNLPGLDKVSITNAKGEFALRMPDATGKLDVRATARALAPQIERMLVPGERRTIHLIEGTAITGHIERDGQPVAGARVVFMQRDRRSANYLGRTEIATNGSGFFMMTSLGPNEEYVVFTPDLAADPKLVKTGADGTSADAGTLKVGAGRRVAGKVEVPAGQPMPTLVLTGDYTATSHTITPSADGTFAFEAVPAEPSQLTARYAGPPLASASTPSGALTLSRRPNTATLPGEGDLTEVRLVFGTR
jgi:hypothetical protein